MRSPSKFLFSFLMVLLVALSLDVYGQGSETGDDGSGASSSGGGGTADGSGDQANLSGVSDPASLEGGSGAEDGDRVIAVVPQHVPASVMSAATAASPSSSSGSTPTPALSGVPPVDKKAAVREAFSVFGDQWACFITAMETFMTALYPEDQKSGLYSTKPFSKDVVTVLLEAVEAVAASFEEVTQFPLWRDQNALLEMLIRAGLGHGAWWDSLSLETTDGGQVPFDFPSCRQQREAATDALGVFYNSVGDLIRLAQQASLETKKAKDAEEELSALHNSETMEARRRATQACNEAIRKGKAGLTKETAAFSTLVRTLNAPPASPPLASSQKQPPSSSGEKSPLLQPMGDVCRSMIAASSGSESIDPAVLETLRNRLASLDAVLKQLQGIKSDLEDGLTGYEQACQKPSSECSDGGRELASSSSAASSTSLADSADPIEMRNRAFAEAIPLAKQADRARTSFVQACMRVYGLYKAALSAQCAYGRAYGTELPAFFKEMSQHYKYPTQASSGKPEKGFLALYAHYMMQAEEACAKAVEASLQPTTLQTTKPEVSELRAQVEEMRRAATQARAVRQEEVFQAGSLMREPPYETIVTELTTKARRFVRPAEPAVGGDVSSPLSATVSSIASEGGASASFSASTASSTSSASMVHEERASPGGLLASLRGFLPGSSTTASAGTPPPAASPPSHTAASHPQSLASNSADYHSPDSLATEPQCALPLTSMAPPLKSEVQVVDELYAALCESRSASAARDSGEHAPRRSFGGAHPYGEED